MAHNPVLHLLHQAGIGRRGVPAGRGHGGRLRGHADGERHCWQRLFYGKATALLSYSSFSARSTRGAENTNGVLGVGSDSTRADGYYHWGALHALVAMAETGAYRYPSPLL